MSCAFADCGNPRCEVCWWGRQPQQGTRDDRRKNERAELPGAKGTRVAADEPLYNEDGRLVAMPKRTSRVGPHR